MISPEPIIGVAVREPNPTPADQWSQWDTNPTIPGSWPGLDAEHKDGFEIERRGVLAVSGKLVNLAMSARQLTPYYYYGGGGFDLHWTLLRELDKLVSRAQYAVFSFWGDLHEEAGMAGLLIERASQQYDLADQPRLGDIPLSELDKRVVGMMPGDPPSHILGEPSEFYPNGGVTLELPKAIDYGVGNMTAAKAKEDLERYLPPADARRCDQAADSLVELANTLQGRAQDLRDAPWRGAAADNAQTALRQIYASATALASVSGKLAAANRNVEQVFNWCRENFERVADPDRGGWDEFWDFGGTPDSRTRDFLAGPNKQLMEIYDAMPKRIHQDLPGLMVTDKSLATFREQVHWVETRPKNSQWQKDNDKGWLEDNKPILEGYEEAEKKYG
ncbi:WXG100 family type VII secretion target [Nonomuraea sp. NPDC050536]|uniref:WXG100 family type VII secretion target n=1 Tax=Nonomuraea sp. NPDC050536 TaxID=3364366 RepID=UPI0037CBA8AC